MMRAPWWSVVCAVWLAAGSLAGCGDDGTAGGGGTGAAGGGAGGSGGQGAAGGANPGPEGWYPSKGETPHYFLQPDDIFQVHPSHPRLYFRQADIPWLIERSGGPLADQWDELTWMASSMAEEDPTGSTATGNVKGWYGRKGRAVALLALLNDDGAYLDWAVSWAKALAALEIPEDDTSLRSRLQRMATVYDWLYDRMSAEDRAAIRTGLVAYVEALRDWGYIQDPGYIGGHERWGYAVFAMGLIALHGDYDEADELLQQCRGHIAEGFYPAQAWIADDGGYHMGWAYSASYTNFDLPYLVWTVGTNDVLLDDWIAETGDWYLYGMRGDDLFPQAGDAFSIGLSLGSINSIYAAGIGKRGQARWFIEEKLEPTSNPLLQLLVWDDAVESVAPTELPKGRLFQNAGLVVARDGWDGGTTHFTFKSGAFFSTNHHHRDENTFTLHYQTPLAIDSGYYDQYGTSHWRNYFTRTIAHNGIVVFDPSQSMTLYGDEVSNDGGQLFNSEPRTLADIAPGGSASLDGIVRYENREELTYAWGDATKAYDPARVTLAQREVAFLRATTATHPVTVLFDRVTSSSAALQKRFVLHTVEQPTTTGPLMAAEHGAGRLTSLTLYPTDAQLSLVGGVGQEFWVDGQNYPLDPNGAEGDPADKGIVPGGWRLEVTPGQASTEDYFLHVLFVDDAGATAVPADEAVLLEHSGSLGVQVAGWVVVFPRSSGGASAVDYQLQIGGTYQHLVAGFTPGQTVTASVGGTSQGNVVVGDGGCAVFEVTAGAGEAIGVH